MHNVLSPGLLQAPQGFVKPTLTNDPKPCTPV